MNRSDLQRLSELRLREAQALFEAGAFEGSYYLAGYAVECALKACIAKRTREFDFPDKRAVERSYTHDLRQLMVVAELADVFHEEADRPLALSWETVLNWSEASRYALSMSEGTAQNMLVAVSDELRGVLTWLKRRW